MDDDLCKRLVEKARLKIYVKGVPVNSKNISDIIGEYSLTPTWVRIEKFDPLVRGWGLRLGVLADVLERGVSSPSMICKRD